MRRALLAFVLALSVVAAGCNSFFDGVGPTPAPETTHLSGELAPGLSAEGVTDRSELTEAHARILLQKSFTVRFRLVERATGGDVRGRRTSTTRIGSNHGRYSIHAASNRSMMDVRVNEYAMWSNGSLLLIAMTVDGRTDYRRSQGGDGFFVGGVESATNHDRLYVLFTAMNVTRVERIETAKSGTPTDGSSQTTSPIRLLSPETTASIRSKTLRSSPSSTRGDWFTAIGSKRPASGTGVEYTERTNSG